MMLKTDDFQDPEVVIIDFGVSQDLVSERQKLCGTPGYIPPETLDTTKWYPKGDCFSLGVTMMQLVIDQVPELGTGPDGAPMMVKMGIFSEGAESIDDACNKTRVLKPPFHRMPKDCVELTRLLERLLEKKMETRMTATQALNDHWFTSPSVGHSPLRSAPLLTAPLSKITVQRHDAAPTAAPKQVVAPLQSPCYMAPSVHPSVRPASARIHQNTAYVMPIPPRAV